MIFAFQIVWWSQPQRKKFLWSYHENSKNKLQIPEKNKNIFPKIPTRLKFLPNARFLILHERYLSKKWLKCQNFCFPNRLMVPTLEKKILVVISWEFEKWTPYSWKKPHLSVFLNHVEILAESKIRFRSRIEIRYTSIVLCFL